MTVPTTDDLALVAAIVQRNVDDYAATTDALIEFEKGSARRLAKALLAFDAAIEQSQVVDRRLLDVQARFAATFELAERYIREDV
jgi:hypothetical protein